MAHGIKKILIDKKEELECNNNQQCVNSIGNNKMALNSLLLDNNCCMSTTSNQNLLNQKNSSTNTNAIVAATHQSLPPTQITTLMNNSNGNKLTLNCSGASMSTITSSVGSSKSPNTTTTTSTSTAGTKMGSRRIFTPQFKLQVLESYRNDNDCKGNQRATARKYGIHRRQIQKWLQCENNLRSIIANNPQNVRNNAIKSIAKASAPILTSSTSSRHRGVVGANTDKHGGTYSCFTLTNVKNYKGNGVGSSTKSLSSSSSSSSSFNPAVACDFSIMNNATAIEANKGLPFYQLSNSNNNNMISTKSSCNGDELPIDLSSSASSASVTTNYSPTQIKIKSEFLARPIPIHPSSSNYKIPTFFTNYLPQPQTSISSPHQLIDISNSVVKSESNIADPIDLSISNVSHKRKHSTDNVNNKDDNKKPIKLFRPYLESNFDNDDIDVKQEPECDRKEQSNYHDAQKFPIIWSNAYNFYPDHNSQPNPQHFHTINHPFLMSASSPTSFYDSQNLAIPMTPSSALSSPSNLSSPNDSGIMTNYHHHHQTTLMPPSQASPVSGYDSSTSSIYSFNDNEVDLSQGNSPSYTYTSSHYAPSPPLISSATLSPTNETKVPLSSTFLQDLKFKLHALDCYYNDAECKRNEKLVANKLNINCKVVEKWLRQESDLRHQQKQYHLQILV
jgi:transposase-like protein